MRSTLALDIFGDGAGRGGLPAWTYDSDEMTELEKELVFRQQWLLVGHVSEIPEPGDYMTLDVADERALTLRGRDGVVRTFHNLCRHRGSRVVGDAAGNCGSVITCPFHGWSYGLDGTLRGMPARKSFPRADSEELGLKPVEQEIWRGFVFVRFKPGDGPSPSEMLAPLEDEVAPYRLDELAPLSNRYRNEFAVNWKAMMDVDNEGYHVPIAHPSLQDLYGGTYFDETLPDGAARSFATFEERNHKLWSVRHYARILPEATHLPESHRRAWLYLTVFPSTGFTFYPDSVGYYQFLPIDTRQSVMVSRTYGLPDERREMKLARYLSARIDAVTTEEDIELMHWMTEGMRSSAYDDQFLSDLESNVRGYHDQLRDVVPAYDLPEAPPKGTLAERNRALAASRDT
jgi:phenylpropionate dioxygenase-like ring-hydroxylating dioxygenase large terminal subunit